MSFMLDSIQSVCGSQCSIKKDVTNLSLDYCWVDLKITIPFQEKKYNEVKCVIS